MHINLACRATLIFITGISLGQVAPTPLHARELRSVLPTEEFTIPTGAPLVVTVPAPTTAPGTLSAMILITSSALGVRALPHLDRIRLALRPGDRCLLAASQADRSDSTPSGAPPSSS